MSDECCFRSMLIFNLKSFRALFEIIYCAQQDRNDSALDLLIYNQFTHKTRVVYACPAQWIFLS